MAPSGARALLPVGFFETHGEGSLYRPRWTLTTCVVACEEGLSPMCLNILGNPAVGPVSPGGRGMGRGEGTWP